MDIKRLFIYLLNNHSIPDLITIKICLVMRREKEKKKEKTREID